MHVYPLFESVVAARAGHDAAGHRRRHGGLFAPFSEVAADQPVRLVPAGVDAPRRSPPPRRRTASSASPTPSGCRPFSDRTRARHCWSARWPRPDEPGWPTARSSSGPAPRRPTCASPSARPDLGRSPGIAAAGEALFEAARVAAGGPLGIDDVELLDLYSCFPSAVELAGDALGIATDDPRGLTVTGGLPYFGGPGQQLHDPFASPPSPTVCVASRDGPGSARSGWPPGSGGT